MRVEGLILSLFIIYCSNDFVVNAQRRHPPMGWRYVKSLSLSLTFLRFSYPTLSPIDSYITTLSIYHLSISQCVLI